MKTAKTATEAKMPPTRKLAACWNRPSSEAGDDGAAVVAHAAERDRHEAIEGQHRRIGEKGEQHLAAGKARERADRRRRCAKLAMRRLRSGRPSARAA